jgi:hypothetical protein
MKATTIACLLLALLCLGCSSPEPKKTYRVAVIDSFLTPASDFTRSGTQDLFVEAYGYDVDYDDIEDPYFHGDLVCLFLQDPEIEIVKIDTDRERTLFGFLKGLAEVERRVVIGGERFDAVSLSLEYKCPRFLLTDTFFGEILSENREEYIARIQDLAGSEGEVAVYGRIMIEVIRTLERVTALGIPVYVPVGNSKPNFMNVLSLAKGTFTVGCPEDNIEVQDTGFVVFRAPFTFDNLRVMDGYDVDGDGIMDVPSESLSGGGEAPGRTLQGTSFSVPYIVKRRLLGKALD